MAQEPLYGKEAFRRLLTSTVVLPLVLLGFLAAAFVGQILYDKSLNRWPTTPIR